MAKDASAAKLTYRDLLELPDDGLRHEIIDGVHLVTPSPVPRHQRAVVRLVHLLEGFLEQHPVGTLYVAPCDVVISEHDVVEPDLLFVSSERADRVGEEALHGSPDLAVEVLSPGTRARDVGVKLRLYERSGVREYWVVDPDAETVEVLRIDAGRFQRAARLARARGDLLTTPVLPGFSAPLESIFPPLRDP